MESLMQMRLSEAGNVNPDETEAEPTWFGSGQEAGLRSFSVRVKERKKVLPHGFMTAGRKEVE